MPPNEILKHNTILKDQSAGSGLASRLLLAIAPPEVAELDAESDAELGLVRSLSTNTTLESMRRLSRLSFPSTSPKSLSTPSKSPRNPRRQPYSSPAARPFSLILEEVLILER
jgi:hypothetical protein